MARKPAALAAPSTAKELKDLLWKSADKPRYFMTAPFGGCRRRWRRCWSDSCIWV